MRTLSRQFQALSTFIVLFMAVTTLATADDRFAVAVGSKDMLMIYGPKGEHIAALAVPSISEPVTIGSTTFQVSYGRDANNLLTAIFAPNPAQPQDLHFNVLNKSVDSDKQAVITMTFSNNLNHVTVDPGYVGVVQVNAHEVRHREVADDVSAPAPVSELTPQPMTTASVAPRDLDSSSPAPAPVDTSTTAALPPAGDASAPSSAYTPVAANQPLFWSEPVTSPDGTAPHVAIDQMKLVEVKGPVTVKLRNGETREGTDGMIIPSGSTIETSDDSSAAVFMGGVNSARLLPDTNVKVSQDMSGTVRKTSLDLKSGGVFSRVGRRPGETQDYQVHTPDGVAAARGTDYATVYKNGHTYCFVSKGSVALLNVNGVEYKVVLGSPGSVGKQSMPPAADTEQVYAEALQQLQAFNGKLLTILGKLSGGQPLTPQEQAYYNGVLIADTAINPQLGSVLTGSTATVVQVIPDPGSPQINPLALNPFARRGDDQVFFPFGTVPTTPY